ncbi:MAG: patatin family protein [Firmicutes bacterium]|nr:patatin family protein [Bacillota bacterium]
MRKGLVLEGGAMRGMFTNGVTDVMMENGITYDGLVGVSAGAAFGCNYKSNQPGRAIRYNTDYCNDPRYCSFRSLIKTGDIYGAEFCYEIIPDTLDIFDWDTFVKNPMEFHVVCTDVDTGKAVYKQCDEREGCFDWIRASASMPMVSRISHLGGHRLLDGGMADSIPLRYFEGLGYEKNVVVLTQPRDFVKKKTSTLPLMRILLGKYPNLIKTVENRPDMYNETLRYIEQREKDGAVLVIAPETPLEVGAVEKDAQKLWAVYHQGRAVMEKQLDQLKEFLK